MTVPLSVLVACGISLASGAGVIANETSHGGMAEAMGFGNHHLAHIDDSQCADNATAPMGHMHGGAMSGQAHCGGAGMHGDGNQTMRSQHG